MSYGFLKRREHFRVPEESAAVHRGEMDMPYVNIKVTREGVTSAQKAELIAGVTDLLQQVLGKNPATTVVVIDEVDTDNWGLGGEQVTRRRTRGQ
jgi:4-oxalocrotonate tautomerase